MSFNVAADAYDRFMGRYSVQLAPQMCDLAGVGAGQRVLDVGSGPGALTTELVGRLGADAVAAVDPSAPFVEAARARHPGVVVEQASADALPFEDASFDATLAQLVVHFMPDPVAGLAEMRRVTRPGGVVAACVWDFGGDVTPHGPFWVAAREVVPDVPDEAGLPGARDGHLVELSEAAGLHDVTQAELWVSLIHATFEAWWNPYEEGVGPAGKVVAGLDEAGRAVLRERCRELLPEAPFTITGRAWASRGLA
jgi:SAM-dependent methyltransferase